MRVLEESAGQVSKVIFSQWGFLQADQGQINETNKYFTR